MKIKVFYLTFFYFVLQCLGGFAVAQSLGETSGLDQQLKQVALLKELEDHGLKEDVSIDIDTSVSLGPEKKVQQPAKAKSVIDMPVGYMPPMLGQQQMGHDQTVPGNPLEQIQAAPPGERPVDIELNGPFFDKQPVRTPQEATLNSLAFEETIKQLLPLTPEQIHRLRQLYESAQYAAAAPAGVPPKPAVTTRFVKLDPGATAPVIRLAAGFVTTVAFLDSTGAPWQIEAYSIGKPGDINIQWNMRDNILLMQASELYSHGNMAVKLRNLNTPVMLTLVSGQKIVDYRVDLRVQGFGPDAQPPAVSSVPPAESADLLGVLDRIPPQGSKVLRVSDGLGEAWLKDNSLFLRTRLTVLSPGWLASMSSADGMKAYELNKTPMVLASHNGKVIELKIEGL